MEDIKVNYGYDVELCGDWCVSFKIFGVELLLSSIYTSSCCVIYHISLLFLSLYFLLQQIQYQIISWYMLSMDNISIFLIGIKFISIM